MYHASFGHDTIDSYSGSKMTNFGGVSILFAKWHEMQHAIIKSSRSLGKDHVRITFV